MDKKAFNQHRVNGIYLNFPNGNGLSTIWGIGSHTENHFLINDIYKDGYDADKLMKQWNTPLTSNDVEVMPDCSKIVKEMLDKAFPDNVDGDIYNHLTFGQWLEMVNILNTNK